MGRYGKILKTTLFACLAAFALSACGGGGGGVTVLPATTQAAVVEGIAAAGAPLTGTVLLSDSSSPSKIASAAINRDGAFSLNVTGLRAPFILKAADSSGNAFYSFAKTPGIANINPLTSLSVAISSGATDSQDLADVYANHNMASMQGIANSMNKARADLTSALEPLLALYGAASADPFSGPYSVNTQGLDGLFDQVAVTISGGIVTLAKKDNTVIFAAPVGSISSGAIITGNLPIPAVSGMPGNAVLTLKVQGDLPEGTRIKVLSLSIGLPLGVTVESDKNDTTGLTSVFNTAIPTGGAVGSNVYPAPALSATNNILSISMSSLAGFETGEFIAIRLLISSSSLMAATTPNSFSIPSSSMYADIYKNQKLKGLAIAPVSLVYPAREGKQTYDSICARCHTLDQSDSVITPSLFKKTDLVADRFKSAHHGVTLTKTQLEYLQEFMTAFFSGQQIF